MKWFLIMLLAACGMANGQIRIVTTATDYADIAKQIGDGKVTVHSVMKGPENVHNVMAKPTEMVFLNQADLFVHSGLDTEPWRDNLLRGARNPKIAPGKPGWVDMSNGIELKEVPTGKIDRSQGDVHAFGNPHFTLNPQVAQKMTVTLVKAMIAVDPANADLYRANAEKFVNEMTDLSREIQRQFAPYAGLKVVTFHKAWEYFADAVPIDIVGTIEPKPAITPSPAQVQQTIQLMKDQSVKVVICETYDDPKLARYIADQAGAKMVVLPDHVLGVPQADTYENLFRYDVQKLIDTAQAAGIAPKAQAGALMHVSIEQAHFGYTDQPVVRVEQLDLHPGRCLGIFGPNGAGKTTLVRGMVGLLAPMRGVVTRSPDLRFGYLPQHRAMDLNWPMTGLDAASMAISARSRFGWMGRNQLKVRQALAAMEVSDLANRPFAKLSGGQQQRLLLAGAIATEPQVLVLDEPTDGLDVRSRQALLDLLRQQNRSGLCTVMISHEVEDLLYLSDQIAWLHRGDDPQEPSRVEMIAATALAERMMQIRRAEA